MGPNGYCLLMICVIINLIISSYLVDALYPNVSIATYKPAKTMTNWIYFRVPRTEAIIVKLQGRSLHPGEMSCWKNPISLTEFTSEFVIYFPTARRGSTYSLVINSDVEVFYVKYGLVAESVFRGIKGPDTSITSQLANFSGFKKVYVTLFEENPQRSMTLLDPASLRIGVGLHALETIVGNTWGVAGKVCMQLRADKFEITSKPRTINHEFQKNIETLGNGW